MAGSPYKKGKKIAANVYYREALKRSKAVTWQQKKKALEIFTQLSGIWGGEYNKHFSAAAELNYRQANVMESKKVRTAYREAVIFYKEALNWVPGYKDTEKRIKIAEMNSYATFYVLEKFKKDPVKADTSQIASDIEKNLSKPDHFKNFNNDKIREQLNPDVYAQNPNMLIALKTYRRGLFALEDLKGACKATGTNVIVYIEAISGSKLHRSYKTSQLRQENSPEYLTNQYGQLVCDARTNQPVVAKPGIFDNQTISDALTTGQKVKIDCYTKGSVDSRYDIISKHLKFKKYPLMYKERTCTYETGINTKVTIYDVSRNKVLDVLDKIYKAEEKVTWRINKKGKRGVFAEKLDREYQPKSPKDFATLKQESFKKYEKETAKWVAEKLSKYYL